MRPAYHKPMLLCLTAVVLFALVARECPAQAPWPEQRKTPTALPAFPFPEAVNSIACEERTLLPRMQRAIGDAATRAFKNEVGLRQAQVYWEKRLINEYARKDVARAKMHDAEYLDAFYEHVNVRRAMNAPTPYKAGHAGQLGSPLARPWVTSRSDAAPVAQPSEPVPTTSRDPRKSS